MAKLAGWFVSVGADDSQAQATVRRVRESLTSLDRQRVQPKITLPEKAADDIAGLSRKLQALAKQRVALNVNSTVAKADIDALSGRLEKLKRNRVNVPVDLGEQADREIADLQRELAGLTRKQTQIPLKLERVDAKIAAVKGALDKLERDDVDIKVDLDKSRSLKGKLASIRQQVQTNLANIDTRKSGEAAGDKFGSGLKSKIGAGMVGAGAAVGVGIGAGLAASFGKIIKIGNEYAGSLNTFQAVTEATGAQMEAVRQTSIALGNDIKLPGVSAAGAATTMTELAKAGLSVEESMKAANGTLALSLAATVSEGKAAEIAANALNAFHISADRVNVVSDQLAATANASSVEITDVADAMGMASAVFSTFQRPALGAEGAMTSLNTALGILGNVGIKGSDAGTSLKQSLLQLVNPSIRSANLMDAINMSANGATLSQEMLSNAVSQDGKLRGKALDAMRAQNEALGDGGDLAYDAAGKMRPFQEIIRRITVGTKDWTNAERESTIAQIFGADATRSILALVEAGPEKYAAMEKAVTRQGAAAEVAAAKSKGLGGAMDNLQGTLETVGISVYTKIEPALTTLVQGVTQAIGKVSAFGRSPLWDAIKDTAADAFAGVGVALAPIGLLMTEVLIPALKALGGFYAENRVAVNAFAIAFGVLAASMKAYLAVQTIVAAGGLLAFIKTVVTSTRLWAAAQAVLNVALTANPIGIVVVALAALAAGIVYAYKNSETFRDIVNRVGAALKGTFLAAVDGVRSAIDWLGRAWGTVAAATGTAWTSIQRAVSTGWQAIVGFFRNATASVVTPVTEAWEGIRSAASRVFAAVGEVIRTAIGIWATIVRTQIAIVLTVVKVAWEAIQKVVELAMDGLRVVITKLWSWIGPYVKAALIAVGTVVLDGWDAISRTTTRVWDAIRVFISKTWGLISEGFRVVMDAIRQAFSTWWTNLSTRATEAFDAIKGFLSRTWTAIKDSVFGDAMRLIRTAFSTWWTNLSTRATEAFNAIKKFISDTWTALKDVVFATAMRLIREAFSTWWTNLSKRATDAFTAIKDFMSTTWTSVKKIWSDATGAVKGTWDGFWRNINDATTTAIGNVKRKFNDFFGPGGTLRTLFSRAVDAVGTIWDRVKAKVDGPVARVREIIGRLVDVYNSIAKKVGAAEIRLPTSGPSGGGGSSRSAGGRMTPGLARGGIVELARGGVMPGYTPGRDVHHFVSPTGGRLNLSGGEAVMRPEWTAAVGKDTVDAMNRTARLHGRIGVREQLGALGFAKGGVIPEMSFFLGGTAPTNIARTSRHNSGYPWATWAGDLNGPGNDMGQTVRAWKAGVVAAVRHLTTSYGKHVRINHAGNQRTLYAHLSRIAVDAGQRVRAGQKIGELGSTGNSSGPHLHFELAGGSDSVGSGSGDPSFMERVIDWGAQLAGGLRKIGTNITGSPFAQMLSKLPGNLKDAMIEKGKSWIQTIVGKVTGGSAGSSRGDGPRAAAARSYINQTWPQIRTIYGFVKKNIAGTNTPSKHSVGKALDLMTSNRGLGNEIANYFAGPGRGKFGVDNVIWNRRIHNQRGWHGYNGSNPHTDHVHVDFFKNGGIIPEGGLASGGLVRGGRGGVTSRIGEGRFDELVTPLPRNFDLGRQSTQLDRIAELLAERGGLGAAPAMVFNTYNPVAEPQSVTTNRALQRIEQMDLV